MCGYCMGDINKMFLRLEKDNTVIKHIIDGYPVTKHDFQTKCRQLDCKAYFRPWWLDSDAPDGVVEIDIEDIAEVEVIPSVDVKLFGFPDEEDV